MIEPPIDPPDYWEDEQEEAESDISLPDDEDHRTAFDVERDAARCEDAREAQLDRHYLRLERGE